MPKRLRLWVEKNLIPPLSPSRLLERPRGPQRAPRNFKISRYRTVPSNHKASVPYREARSLFPKGHLLHKLLLPQCTWFTLLWRASSSIRSRSPAAIHLRATSSTSRDHAARSMDLVPSLARHISTGTLSYGRLVVCS